MVIFHSYVSLPEGIYSLSGSSQKRSNPTAEAKPEERRWRTSTWDGRRFLRDSETVSENHPIGIQKWHSKMVVKCVVKNGWIIHWPKKNSGPKTKLWMKYVWCWFFIQPFLVNPKISKCWRVRRRVLQRWRCRDFPYHPFSSPCSAVVLKKHLKPQSSQSVHISIHIYMCISIYILWHPYPQWFPLNAELLQVLSHLSLGLKKPANRSYRFRIVDLEIEKKVGSIYIYTGWWLTYPSEKYWSNGNIIPNIWKNEKCSTPPTSMYIYIYLDKRTLHRPRLWPRLRRYS